MITSVGVHIYGENYSTGESLTVRIHEFDDGETNDLGDLVATLTTPTLTEGAMNYFTAPDGTTLEPNTQYIVNFHSTGNLSNPI